MDVQSPINNVVTTLKTFGEVRPKTGNTALIVQKLFLSQNHTAVNIANFIPSISKTSPFVEYACVVFPLTEIASIRTISWGQTTIFFFLELTVWFSGLRYGAGGKWLGLGGSLPRKNNNIVKTTYS